jgi:rare lipoprotein A
LTDEHCLYRQLSVAANDATSGDAGAKRRPRLIVLSVLALLWAGGCAQNSGDVQEGEASFYADSLHGSPTANGETYDRNALTAAHPSLPFGTRLRVTSVETGKSVVVVVNDRGPYADGRIVDLSRAAARAIGLIDEGHARVRLEVIEP